MDEPIDERSDEEYLKLLRIHGWWRAVDEIVSLRSKLGSCENALRGSHDEIADLRRRMLEDDKLHAEKRHALESRLDSVRTLVEAYYNHEQAGTGETLYAIKKIVVERGTTK